MSWYWLSGTGIQYWPIKPVFLCYTFCLLSQLISFIFISHPLLLWAMLIIRWCTAQSECLYMDFAGAGKWYVSEYLEEIYLKLALAISFFFRKLAKSVGKNGTSVWEVPVQLKAVVLNSALCLLPANAVHQQSCSWAEALKVENEVCY